MTNNEPPRSRWVRLRQHAAFHAAVIFASAGWLLLQAASVFEVPTSTLRVLGALTIIGFAALAGFAWVASGRESTETALRIPLGRKHRGRTVTVAVVVLLALGAGTWWFREQLFRSPVKSGADVIAVLPFSTSGPSVALLGEGLVDLFSTNLNEVGDIRTVDPRTTLYHWRRIAPKGGTDLDGALRVGRAVKAGSVLLGSVVEAGGRVRLSARLVDLDGGVLASAEDNAPSDSVFSLVDRLSVKLLSEIWRPREKLPSFRLSAITTTSPSALRAYLRGEQFYRRSQWDSARTAFELAVAQDSTFALAHFRLGESYGWTESLGSASARRSSAAAQRLADRLPARERALVTAHRLLEDGETEAIDSLRAFLQRFPDDVVGWHFLADAQWHASAVLGLTARELFVPFDRVLELDSSFSPALQHPIEMSVALGDSARFRRYLRTVESLHNDGPEEVFLRAIEQVRWGPRAKRPNALAHGIRNTMRTPNDANRLITALISASLADSKPNLAEISSGLDSARAALSGQPGAATGIEWLRTLVHMAFGRFERASTLLDTLRAVSPDLATNSAIIARSSGMAPRDFGAADLQRFEQAPLTVAPVAYWKALLAIAANDLPKARNILKVAPRDTTAVVTPDMFDAVAGWVTALEGDTSTGLRQLDAATRRAGFRPATISLSGPLYIARVIMQLENPDSREHAHEHLRYKLAMDPMLEIFAAQRLGEALERAGMRDEAARIYAHALAVLEGADPSIQENVAALRTALSRLRAER